MRQFESQIRELRSILDEFSVVNARSDERERAGAIAEREAFAGLLDEFASVERRWRAAECDIANTFNVLEAMGVSGDELLHSCILAWLFSHDIRSAGSHAQGNLGFRLFLEETGLPSKWADTQYFVARERQGLKSRIDIEIACPREFLIHIENKVWADEGKEQLPREWRDMERRAAELGVPLNETAAFFLTRDGRKSKSEHPGFRTLSWVTIGQLFLRFSKQARARVVQMFAEHYAQAVRQSIHKRDYLRDQ